MGDWTDEQIDQIYDTNEWVDRVMGDGTPPERGSNSLFMRQGVNGPTETANLMQLDFMQTRRFSELSHRSTASISRRKRPEPTRIARTRWLDIWIACQRTTDGAVRADEVRCARKPAWTARYECVYRRGEIYG